MTKQRTRPQPEARRTENRSRGGPGHARRFEVVAIPGRHILQGHMDTVRTVLIVLGLVTVGIVAYAQWLAFQPNPHPAATLAAINEAMYEEAFPTATAAWMPPRSEALVPAYMRTPRPTNTLVPLPTARPRGQPAASDPPASPTPVPAPQLVMPVDGVVALETMVFEWAWEGLPLEDNQAFDLRIWSVQEEESGSPRRGVVPPTREMQLQVSISSVPAIVDFGPGDYLWTVVIVELDADGSPSVVGAWGESRRLEVR